MRRAGHQPGQGRAGDHHDLEGDPLQGLRGRLLTGLFPIPGYAPPGGYHLDPALMLAFTREESKFQANAVSGADVQIEFTIGIAASPRDSTDPAELFRIADARLYEKKGITH